MKWFYTYLLLTASCSLAPGQAQSASAQTVAGHAVDSIHVVHVDIPYGDHDRQIMDIHVATDAERLEDRNYTIVFLHGGGFSFGDKSNNGRYVTPFLENGMNVVNMSYRIGQGVPAAMEDLTNALNHLARNNDRYGLDLSNVVVAGFSAGGTIATTVGFSQNDPGYPYPLREGIRITGILNFSGPVDQLEVIEEIFRSSPDESWQLVGNNLFPPNPRFTREEMIEKFTPFTYFDADVPPIFLSHGGRDDQVPPSTFARFIEALTNSFTYHRIVFYPEAGHSLQQQELHDTFIEVFHFLDSIRVGGYQETARSVGGCDARLLNEATVVGANSAYEAALRASDTDALQRVLASDFLFITSSGEVRDRQEILRSYGAKEVNLEVFESENVQVRFYGSVGILTADISKEGHYVTGTRAGAVFTGRYRFTRVYACGAQGWQLVSTHESELNQ